MQRGDGLNVAVSACCRELLVSVAAVPLEAFKFAVEVGDLSGELVALVLQAAGALGGFHGSGLFGRSVGQPTRPLLYDSGRVLAAVSLGAEVERLSFGRSDDARGF